MSLDDTAKRRCNNELFQTHIIIVLNVHRNTEYDNTNIRLTLCRLLNDEVEYYKREVLSRIVFFDSSSYSIYRNEMNLFGFRNSNVALNSIISHKKIIDNFDTSYNVVYYYY